MAQAQPQDHEKTQAEAEPQAAAVAVVEPDAGEVRWQALERELPEIALRGIGRTAVERLLSGKNGSSAVWIAVLAEACADPRVRSPLAVVPMRVEAGARPDTLARARRALGEPRRQATRRAVESPRPAPPERSKAEYLAEASRWEACGNHSLAAQVRRLAESAPAEASGHTDGETDRGEELWRAIGRELPWIARRGIDRAAVENLLAGKNGSSAIVLAVLADACADSSVRSPLSVVPTRIGGGARAETLARARRALGEPRIPNRTYDQLIDDAERSEAAGQHELGRKLRYAALDHPDRPDVMRLRASRSGAHAEVAQ